MKKLLLIGLIFFLPIRVSADPLNVSDILSKVPLKQGIAYSLIDNKIEYLSTLEIANWRGLAAEVGYSSNDMLVGVLSYEFMKLEDMGVTLPILDLIDARIGAYIGVGRMDW